MRAVNQKRKAKTMKLANSTILGIVVAGCFTLTAYVMGQGHGPGTSAPTNTGQSMQGQSARDMSNPNTSTTNAAPSATASEPPGISRARSNVKTSPTPKGHHYGWQKGKHNPHRSASVSGSASPSATASGTASAMPTAAATARPQSTARMTAPPSQTP